MPVSLSLPERSSSRRVVSAVSDGSAAFADLLDASFRGVFFHCQSFQDTATRAVAVHQYPYREGGGLDDMGRGPRRHDIRAIFYGPAWKSETEAFLAALNQGGEGELVHPMLGSLAVMVQDYKLSKDSDGPDSCFVQATFIESVKTKGIFLGSGMSKVENAAGLLRRALNSAGNLCASGVDAFLQKVREAETGARALRGISSAFSAAAGAFRGADASVEDASAFLQSPATFLSYLTGAAGRVASAVLPGPDESAARSASGNIWGAAAKTPEGDSGLAAFIAADFSAGMQFPVASAAFPPVSLSRPSLAVPVKTEQGYFSAVMPAPAGASLADDVRLDSLPDHAAAIAGTTANLVQTTILADAACRFLLEETANPTLSPADIEAIVADIRRRLQDCMDAVRVVFPTHTAYSITEEIRTAALAVQAMGRKTIDARPPLSARTLSAPANHHLLAHALYKDYSRAGELLRLNPQITDPNRLARGQVVKVYAERSEAQRGM